MIELRPFDTLGSADHGWLKAKHHFSFAGYYDPSNTNHGSLRVWNDDEIAPNSGFSRASPRQHGNHHLCP
jgi:redox-sensitive bicupin YhaK (pirin superfamily)